MMSRKINILALYFMGCVLLLASLPGRAQIISAINFSQDTVTIGDAVEMNIIIKAPIGTTIRNLDFTTFKQWDNLAYLSDTVFLDKYADVEVLDFGTWQHSDMGIPLPASAVQISNQNGQQTITNTIKVALYNVGIFSVLGPNVLTDSNDTTLPSESQKITVLPPANMMAQDSVSLNPIKDIIKEDANWSDYMIYIYILGALLVMGLLGYYFYKNKKKDIPIHIEEEVLIIPAHKKALNALTDLDQKQLWQSGNIKEYQSQLTFIIRRYLEDRYHVNALEMTTDELSSALTKVDFDQKYTGELREILQIADLVKFAKATPQTDIHSMFMVKARSFVENTKQTEDQL